MIISNRRARALLAMLCLAPNEPIDRDHISKFLWPGRFEAQVRASLRQCLLDLGKLLDTDDASGADGASDDEKSPAPDQMIGITREVPTGRLAMMEGRHADAATAFRNAAEIEETEDFSVFKDPPAFWYPVRRDLAAALFAQGDIEGGRAEAQAALELRPKDPVTLALLSDFAGPIEN